MNTPIPETENRHDLHEDSIILEAAVREAGALALGHFFARPRVWSKTDSTPVSEADLAVNRLLECRLAGARPAYGWLSEESADRPSRLDAGRVWIVDPIDGTRAFVDGRPYWSLSVALIENGVPVLGAVYAPALNEYYAACRGLGTWRNRRRVHASHHTGLEGCRILSGKHFFAPGKWRRPWPDMTISHRNSVAYRMALVAAGRFDAVLAPSPKNEWDLAAGDLLLREAGAVVTDMRGAALNYNNPAPRRSGLVAAAPALHDAIMAQLPERIGSKAP